MSRPIRELDATSICGELGVMKFNASELPSDVSAGDVRMCAEHPHGRNRSLDISDGASLAPMESIHWTNGVAIAVRLMAAEEFIVGKPATREQSNSAGPQRKEDTATGSGDPLLSTVVSMD
ncbi:hypothetical protein ACHAQJ_004768 [Trichoderma viride]